jgi:hypothetical protein
MEVLITCYAEPSLPALYTKIEHEHKLQNNYKNGINELGMHNK